MPIYEYRCLDCKKVFTVAVSLSERNQDIIACPGCNGRGVEQVFTSVMVKTDRKT